MTWRSGLHDDPIESLKFSADGRMLAAGNATEGPSRNNVAVACTMASSTISRFDRTQRRLVTCSGTQTGVWEI